MSEFESMTKAELMEELTAYHNTPPAKEILKRLEAGEKAIEAMKKIGELVYTCSCHSDTSNEVTRIFMAYIK